jgi:8-oxo-dGTP diphosphatase
MHKTYIDKLAYILIQDKKVLTTLSKGKDTWYIPGGKREGNESDHEALIREVEEELTVKLVPDTIRHYGTFEASPRKARGHRGKDDMLRSRLRR